MNQIEFEESGAPAFWEMNYQPGDDECKHPLPGDWEFGGATDEDPRTDPRWRPVTYTYLDRMLRIITISQEPFCDHVAKSSHKEKVDGRGRKVFYITSAPEGRKGGMIYSDADGALGATEG